MGVGIWGSEPMLPPVPVPFFLPFVIRYSVFPSEFWLLDSEFPTDSWLLSPDSFFLPHSPSSVLVFLIEPDYAEEQFFYDRITEEMKFVR